MKNMFSVLLKQLRKPEILVMMSILLVAIAVRGYRFGSLPPGLHQDEMTLSYDAWSLMQYGVERNGFHFPVILPAYGSGQSGTLAAYLSMPFLAVFGLNPVGTRMLNLVAGMCSIILFYLLINRLRDRKTALIGAGLLAITPWHIMISRWGLDCNLFPALFLLGTYLLVRAQSEPQFLVASLSVFALSLYSYGTSYVVVPCFLLLSFVYLAYKRHIPWKQFWIGIAAFGVIALPLGLYLLINTFNLPSIATRFFSIPHMFTVPRYSAAVNMYWGDGTLAIWQNLRTFYRVMIPQIDTWWDNSIPGVGTLYIPTLPIVLYGIYRSFPRKAERVARSPKMLMFLWLAAALTLPFLLNPMIHRINIIFLPLVYFTAVGLADCFRYRGASVLIAGIYLALFTQFLQMYFGGPFEEYISKKFAASLDDAILYAVEKTDGNICVTNSDNFTQTVIADMSVLYHTKTDPRVFRETVKYANPDGLYRYAISFDRYVFGIKNCGNESFGAYIVTPKESQSFDLNKMDIEMFDRFWVLSPRE